MFDQITEENDYGRGEGDSDSANDGEDATTHIRKFRQQIEHLNSDLHDLIYEGEDGDSAEEDDIDSFALPHTQQRNGYKKITSGKPQNLDLLPSNYTEENVLAPSSEVVPEQLPSHMIKEVVQVLDEDTYIVQESIFNQRYESEDEMDRSSNNPDETNEENEDRPEDEEPDQPNYAPEEDAPGEEVFDEEEDLYFDDGAHNLQFQSNADQLIQPLLDQEENMFGVPLEGGNYFHPEDSSASSDQNG